MSAVSLNYRDTDMVAGTYPFKFPLPLVPTSDGVGKVVAVGDRVTRAKVADRVLGTFWQSWLGGDSTRPKASDSSAAQWMECCKNSCASTERVSSTRRST